MPYGLTNWDPFRGLLTIQEDTNRLFWVPSMDVEETVEEIVVRAELPGMKKEEIHLQAQGDTLVLTGERAQESRTGERTLHLVERSYGKFHRVIQLPAEVDGTRAKAGYENGVLAIRLPKREESKPREIAIEVK